MRQYRIVCIDDDEHFLQSLEGSLPRRVEAICSEFRCSFEFVASMEELHEVFAEGPIAMLICDQMMPGVSGLDLIEELKSENPRIATVLLTGHGSLDSAKHAINRQLLDQYISKPIEDIDVFVSVVANLLKKHHYDLEERDRTEQLAQTVVRLQHTNEQIGAMQNAAEEIAVLSQRLKTLKIEEVLSLAAEEVPKLFGAKHAALYCIPRTCQTDESCHAEACNGFEGHSPDIVIPVPFTAFDDSREDAANNQGYLCLCGIDSDTSSSPDLIGYKADLVAELLSVSLANAQLYEQAKRDSEIDYLTGVGSRRALEDKLEIEYERALRYGMAFSVIMADIDHFKAINDQYGHGAGDTVLRRLSKALAKGTRRSDFLARYGGDEFVILMPETNLIKASSVAERIRKNVENTVKSGGEPVTVSCGVASWTAADSHSGTDVLHRADAALQVAKKAGRNNVRVDESDMSEEHATSPA